LNRIISKDFLSGLVFIAFGLVAFYFSQNLTMGTAVRMGSGYVPRLLLLILIGMGGLICTVALLTDGEIAERPKWKPITAVTVGIIAFAFLIERAGMLPAAVALVFVGSLGGHEFKLSEVTWTVVALTTLCVIVFKIGLGMNISIIEGIW